MVEIIIILFAISCSFLYSDYSFVYICLRWASPVFCLGLIFLVADEATIKLVFFAKLVLWLWLILSCLRYREVRFFSYAVVFLSSAASIFANGLYKTNEFPLFLLFAFLMDIKAATMPRNFVLLLSFLQAYILSIRGTIGVSLVLFLRPLYRIAVRVPLYYQFALLSSLAMLLHVVMFYDIFYGGDYFDHTASNVERSIYLFSALPSNLPELFWGKDLSGLVNVFMWEYRFTDLGWSENRLATEVHNVFAHSIKFGGTAAVLYVVYLFYKILCEVPVDVDRMQLLVILVYYMGFYPFSEGLRIPTALLLGTMANSVWRFRRNEKNRRSIRLRGNTIT